MRGSPSTEVFWESTLALSEWRRLQAIVEQRLLAQARRLARGLAPELELELELELEFAQPLRHLRERYLRRSCRSDT
tara:strand:- start:75720 stop:75950 length:231 start_codon:yes stop_codon:yes gene_type:complete